MNLHEAIYHLVSNPELASQLIQSSHLLLEQYHLTPAELQVIIDLLKDSHAMSLLTSVEALPAALMNHVELTWVPPQWP